MNGILGFVVAGAIAAGANGEPRTYYNCAAQEANSVTVGKGFLVLTEESTSVKYECKDNVCSDGTETFSFTETFGQDLVFNDFTWRAKCDQ
jgi:hypothetical protein